MSFPEKLQKKVEKRQQEGLLRKLSESKLEIDFSSNDYLGFSADQNLAQQTLQFLKAQKVTHNGATGSRLLSGNHTIYQKTEKRIATLHKTEKALIFNSGYDANLGFFGSVPQRGDVILYDEWIHASIRDGIRMSLANSYKFKHNSLKNIASILKTLKKQNKYASSSEIYVVTESVFSMDGDAPDLKAFAEFCAKNNFHLVVDEAHAIGVFGTNGLGKIQELQLEEQVFARVYTFGKALGCHGAAIVGSASLIEYLINFARSFIYTTGLPPHSVATIYCAYQELKVTKEIQKLQQNIQFFRKEVFRNNLQAFFIESHSAIQCCIIPGNDEVTSIASRLHTNEFDVKAIRYPTVPKNQERLRFCLHSYNSEAQISEVLRLLATFVR